jgi:hypothetical protein
MDAATQTTAPLLADLQVEVQVTHQQLCERDIARQQARVDAQTRKRKAESDAEAQAVFDAQALWDDVMAWEYA